MSEQHGFNPHGTTILGVRRKDGIAIGGDGQVTLGSTVMKGNARKVRRLANDRVIAGFAGGTADAFTLFERFEAKLEKYGNLTRAAIELAKDWRSDRYLRRLEALLLVGDTERLLVISGNGDVIEPEHDVAAIGSGGQYALAAARALAEASELDARSHRRALAQHRRRHLHLHQPQRHHRGTERPPGREGLIGMSSLTPRQIVQELDKHIVGPGRGQARRGHRAAQPLAPHAGAGAAAPGDHAEEHPHDRPDRRRQDRDRAAPGASSPTRRSSRSRPPSSPRSATSAATSTRSSRSWPTSRSR